MLQTLLFILTVVLKADCYFDPYEPTSEPTNEPTDEPTNEPTTKTTTELTTELTTEPNFSIEVKENFTGEAGLCIRVSCFFTIPQSVSEPIGGTWFKGDPQNPTVEVPFWKSSIIFSHREKDCSFMLNNLVQGESDGEYRLKLKWDQGKVYIFPQTVNITVKELNQKPTINVPQLTPGEKAEIFCKVPGDCMYPLADIVWTGIEPDEIRLLASGVPGSEDRYSVLIFHPEAEHHNTKLTCTVIFQKSIQTESTVILKVRHAPIILNSSRCLVWDDELICMCVSSGVPLPEIHWTILDREYYSIASAKNTSSSITVSIASFRNLKATIECVSENLIGKAEMEILVHNHAEKPKVSWSLSTPWIFFTLSVVVNVIFIFCLTFILRRREKYKKPNKDNHVYMTPMKREESVYETLQMSSERS